MVRCSRWRSHRSRVYVNKPETLEALKDNIRHECKNLSSEQLVKEKDPKFDLTQKPISAICIPIIIVVLRFHTKIICFMKSAETFNHARFFLSFEIRSSKDDTGDLNGENGGGDGLKGSGIWHGQLTPLIGSLAELADL
ncbi:unnamed protein product [Arctia plantaginis]|uniref:Uncharacterized protein n=1 Tax=Arctia plantaginis TaxID=874455 RepID=A0A8S0ZC33_ARCPL|nr:unnamed protein product [Arctia plantaginis]